MSVLISGMEMPTSCAECPCASIFAGYKCMAYGRQFDKYPLENRMDWCPLIPVPPHGDLIDRDALMKHKGDCYDAKGHLLYAVGTGNIMRAPTIIPASGK